MKAPKSMYFMINDKQDLVPHECHCSNQNSEYSMVRGLLLIYLFIEINSHSCTKSFKLGLNV